MFNRGSNAFQSEMKNNYTISLMRKFFFVRVDKNQESPYPSAPSELFHMSSIDEAVIVPMHNVMFANGKYIDVLCHGPKCPYCARGFFKMTMAIHKIYNVRQYLSNKSNQMEAVGIQPLLAGSTVQQQLESLASALPNKLKGVMLTHTREKIKSHKVEVSKQQPSNQQVAFLQQQMCGYTDAEILQMIPISDLETAERTIHLVADPNKKNNTQPQNNLGGFGNQNNGNQNTFNNNQQNSGGFQNGNFNNQNNGNQNNQMNMGFGGNQNGGSQGQSDPNLGGGQGGENNSQSSVNTDESIPF